MVPRVVEENPTYELAIMTMMIYSVPRRTNNIDCLVVFPGMGEDWRVIQAVEICNKYRNITTLLIGGVDTTETTYKKITTGTLQDASSKPIRPDVKVIFQDAASQTNHQTDWVVKEAAINNFSAIGLLVSPYHLLRAYCTLLSSFESSNISLIPVLPISVLISPDTIIPETGVDAWRMAMGEYERIQKYQQKGDVASYAQAKDYINWLWTTDAVR
jgi:hypothetical protein